MTVHGSKGLQAPIVILADTTKIKNKSRKSEFLWSDDGLVYFPTSADAYDTNCTKIKAANLEADFDEYRRLLYVALTRAEDRLYIAGFTKTKDASEDSWYKLLAKTLNQIQNFLKTINALSMIFRNKVLSKVPMNPFTNLWFRRSARTF